MNNASFFKRTLLVLLFFVLILLTSKREVQASGTWIFTPFGINQSDNQHVSFSPGDFACSDSCSNDFTGVVGSVCLGSSQGSCDISSSSVNGNLDNLEAGFNSAIVGTYYIKFTAENNNTLISQNSYQFPLQITPTPTPLVPTDTPIPTEAPNQVSDSAPTPTPTPNIVYVNTNTTSVVDHFVPTSTPTPTSKPGLIKTSKTLSPSPKQAVLGASTSNPYISIPKVGEFKNSVSNNIDFSKLLAPLIFFLLLLNISLACLLFKKS